MQDSGSPSFPSSRMLRASRDPNRRNSHNAMALNDDRPTGTSQESSESDRDRHWNTILGQTPGQTEQASSSQTFSNSSRPGHSRHTIAPLRSPHSRVPSSSRTPRRASTQTSTDLGSAARPSRSPTTKPFACDQCVRRFERKGHLKAHIEAVHDLQQPYECHFRGCNRKFSHLSSLNRHLKGVHHVFPLQEITGDRYKRNGSKS